MQGPVWIPQAHDTNSIILSCTYFSSLHFFSMFLFSSLPSSSSFSLHPKYYDWLNIEQVSDWPLGFLNIGMFAPPANINTSSSPFFLLIVFFIKHFQALSSHVHGKIWPHRSQFWLWVFFETPCTCPHKPHLHASPSPPFSLQKLIRKLGTN